MLPRLVRNVVHDLVHPVDAPRRAARERAEGRDARNAHRRPDRIGRRRLQIAVRELRARLVDGAGGQNERVARRDAVIDVVQARRCAWRVQRPHAARVVGGHPVQRVTHAELIGAVHLMVDLAERVGRVHRVRIDARRNRHATIARLRQPRVDTGDAVGRNRDQSGLVQPALLDVGEVERAVTAQRPARAGPVLLLVHRQLRP